MKTTKKQVSTPCYIKNEKKGLGKRTDTPFSFLPKGKSILLPHMTVWN